MASGAGGRAPGVLGVVGEVMLTAGFLLLLYVAYVLWGTGLATEAAQDDLRERTAQAWAAPGSATGGSGQEAAGADPGLGWALLRMPRLGEDFEWVVLPGVDPSDLARGPGHYPGSAAPGEMGNVAIAGHRAGHGAPFARLDRLEPGDEVVLENAAGTWTYLVEGSRIVLPDDTWVVDPVPGRPDAEPTQRRLTLTTCHPRWGSEQRLVVTGLLAEGA